SSCDKQALTSLALASTPVNNLNPLLYHKTTRRQLYERAAADHLGYEVLLYNQQGNVTESTIANVVYEWQGVLYTPPVADGLLPGTLRGKLLEEGVITARSLHLDDCHAVSAWYLVSGLRGRRDAQLGSDQLERTRSLLSICRGGT
ncbi:MAG: hypothetical protein GXP16_18895, partial [Gammaproteobacteria bacterium]|nr:hypothetical protein [Gammaproteobacteria bacterium]